MHAILNPYMSQLGANLAPTWPPKSLQNRSQDGLKTQLPEKLIFATPPMRNASFCSSKRLPKRAKTASKTTCYASAFSTSKKHPPNFDFGLSWASLGPPKAPPRGLQGLSKTSLGSILGHLGCKFDFWASWGVPPGSIFQYFWSKFDAFSIAFDLNIAFTPRTLCTKNCLATTWNLSFSTSQLCSMDCLLELLFAGARSFLQRLFCTPALLLFLIFNVTIVFHGLPVWAYFCINYL